MKKACTQAASGCDYPAGECAGECMSAKPSRAEQLASQCDMEDHFERQVRAELLRLAAEVKRLEQPQGEQEPVAYYVMNGAALFQLFRSKSQAEALVYDLQKRHDLSGSPAHFHVVPLFINPQPKRKPLTEDERQDVYAKAIKAINNDPHLSWRDAIVFETERAHGIGGDA